MSGYRSRCVLLSLMLSHAACLSPPPAAEDAGPGSAVAAAPGVDSDIQPPFDPAAVAGEISRVRRKAALAEAFVSPELVGDAPLIGRIDGEQSLPQIAAAPDGSYLVVWTDELAGNGLVATRVSAAGEILDPSGISVAANASNLAQVAFGGGAFVVAWLDWAAGTVRTTRIDTAGAVVGSATIVGAGGDRQLHDMAFDGSHFLLTWFVINGPIDGVLIDADGLHAGAPFEIDAGASTSFVAASSAGFLVVSVPAYGPIRGRFVGADGVPAASSFVIVDTTPETYWLHLSDVAAGDGIFVVDYTTLDSATYTKRVSATGTVLDPGAGISLGVAVSANVGFDGTGFQHAVRQLDGSTAIRRLGADGTLSGTASIPTIGSYYSGSPMACGAGQCMVISSERGPLTDNDLTATRITAAGEVLDPARVPLATGANVQDLPVIAFNGTDYLIVWEDSRGGGREVVAARVDPSGGVLDPNGIVVGPGPYESHRPAVASDGDGWLVLFEYGPWSSDNELRAAHIDGAGVVQQTTTLATAGGTPQLAFDGVSYVAVWRPNVTAARLATDGTIVGGPWVLDTAFPQSLDVASKGSESLVTWQEWVGFPSVARIRGLRLAPSGTILASFTLASVGNASVVRTPRAATDGAGWLVVYDQDAVVMARKLSATGVLGSPFGLSPSGVPLYMTPQPTVAFDGDRYLVAWTQSTSSFQGDLQGAWVDATGIPVDAGVLASAVRLTPAHLVSGDHGRLAMVYTRDDQQLRGERLRGRFVSFAAPNGTSCVNGTSCTSGICVDGVCCESACAGGNTDCQACSVAAGASEDGTCGPIVAGPLCGATDAGAGPDGGGGGGGADAAPADGGSGVDGSAGVDASVGFDAPFVVPDAAVSESDASTGADLDAGPDSGGAGGDAAVEDSDAGPAAEVDAGSSSAADAGLGPDATGGSLDEAGGGCGCRTDAGSDAPITSLAAVAMVALLLPGRRRRAERARPRAQR